MATDPADCAGSWRPVPHLEPGESVVCDFCKRQVHLRPAPLDLSSGPWPGEKHPRIEPHLSDARVARSMFEMPGSEG